jgi:hypothetical protein
MRQPWGRGGLGFDPEPMQDREIGVLVHLRFT